MFVDKKSTLFCACLPVSQAIHFAFVLQLIALVCTVSFFPWKLSITPAIACTFTALGCYFPHSRCFRIFLLYFDFLRVVLSILGGIAAVIIIPLTN